MSLARSRVAADYEQGLAECRDCLIRLGPEMCQAIRRRFEVLQKSDDLMVQLTGYFALLGLLAAELAIEPEEESA